jgi:hypothetical protein
MMKLSTVISATAEGSLRILRGMFIEKGYVPRYAFAHFFLDADGIRSRLHIQNYYSLFFPDVPRTAEATVWLHSSNGRLLAKKVFKIPPFGQLYLELEDLLGKRIDNEGMIYVDLAPPRDVRSLVGKLPRIEDLVAQTPFWVSYRDENENYMYVHSIETFKGRVFGSLWPLSLILSRSRFKREAWKSWRLLDPRLLEELEIVVMNHGHKTGSGTVQIFDESSNELWRETFSLASRQSSRIAVPKAKLDAWRLNEKIENIRVGVDSLLTPNGKPYVVMRYGTGPKSIHHG